LDQWRGVALVLVLISHGFFFTGRVVICATILILTFLGYEMKLAVIGIGALLLAPCLLAYLFGRPMPASIGQPMQWLGERTYSIYLWQQPFEYLPSVLHPVGVILSVGVEAFWFKIFEQPFLSSRRRQEVVNDFRLGPSK
jgi:peptidoglycan/LPS O-acetylase OafA/YrhL